MRAIELYLLFMVQSETIESDRLDECYRDIWKNQFPHLIWGN